MPKEYDLKNGQSGNAEGSNAPKLLAYRVSQWPPMRLVTAPASRDWMEATPTRFANRCLPLRIANQAGWFVLNSHPLRVTWNGGNESSDLEIEALGEEAGYHASSHFGSEILTFNLPVLFYSERYCARWNSVYDASVASKEDAHACKPIRVRCE